MTKKRKDFGVLRYHSKSIQKNSSTLMQSRTLGGGAEKSTLIEKEMKQLEKIKFKQQKEIEQTIQYETKMQEIRERNDQKMVEQKEREHRRQLELDQKKRE